MASLFLRKIKNKKGEITSKIWYVKWSLNGVPQVPVSTGETLKTKANDFFREFKPEIYKNKNKNLTDLKATALKYAAAQVGDKMYRQYVSAMDHIIRILDNDELANITKNDIENFKAIRGKELKPNGEPFSKFTLNLELAVIKKAFDIALEKKWILTDPTKKVKKHKVKSTVPAMEEEDVKPLLELIKKGTRNIHYYYAIKLALNTGMRRTEIATLKWNQIDFANYKIMLHNKITDDIEYAFFNDAALEVFNELKKSNVLSLDGYIWGRVLNGRNLLRTLKHWCKKLGLNPRLRFHSTRHTYITKVANKENLHTAQELARHANPNTTKNYIKEKDERLKQIANNHNYN